MPKQPFIANSLPSQPVFYSDYLWNIATSEMIPQESFRLLEQPKIQGLAEPHKNVSPPNTPKWGTKLVKTQKMRP